MTLTNRLGRPMLAAMFISGGTDQLRNPESKADVAATVTDEIHERFDDVPLPEEPADMVRINGAVQLVAGSLLALNRLPRLSALALAGSLVPTTLAGHRFWEIEDETDRKTQRVHFLKNMAMLGGLVITVGDTGRRPSAGWRAHRAVRDTADGVTTGVTTKARRFRRSTSDLAGAASDRVTDGFSSSTSTAPALADAADAAAAAAADAFDRAQPAVESAAKETRIRAKELWTAAVPVAAALREHAADLAAHASTLAGKARVRAGDATDRARDAVDSGVGAVRSAMA